MARNSLILGPIVFREFELPECITFGGRQRISRNHLGNGSSVIGVLGAEDADIRFSGIFSGSSATTRAIMLDELRSSGEVMELIWGELVYSVIIKSFLAEYRNANWIPFEIVCVVDRNVTTSLADGSATLIGGALADLGSASGYSTPYGYDLATPMVAVSALKTGLGPESERRRVAAIIRGSVGGLSADILIHDNQGSTVTSSQTAPDAISALSNAIDSSARQWSCVTARGYVQRASIQLSPEVT